MPMFWLGWSHMIILPSVQAEHLVFTSPGGRLILIMGSSSYYYLEIFLYACFSKGTHQRNDTMQMSTPGFNEQSFQHVTWFNERGEIHFSYSYDQKNNCFSKHPGFFDSLVLQSRLFWNLSLLPEALHSTFPSRKPEPNNTVIVKANT